ncbi:unnamed protein product [Caenorhabditis brenneri]
MAIDANTTVEDRKSISSNVGLSFGLPFQGINLSRSKKILPISNLNRRSVSKKLLYSLFRDKQLFVTAKRTNVPEMLAIRGREKQSRWSGRQIRLH